MAKNDLKTINHDTIVESSNKDVEFTDSKSNDIKIRQKNWKPI